VAAKLRVSLRKLRSHLQRHPYFRLFGREKRFTANDVRMLYEPLPCPSNSFHPGKASHRTSEFGELTSSNTLTALQELLTQRKRERSSRKIEREIEAGVFADSTKVTFAGAALSYLQADGDHRFIRPLVKHFGERAISRIDQIAIDNAAKRLYPSASAATRNRQVYTPSSAILKHVGFNQRVKRPKGSSGRNSSRWLRKEEVFAVLEAAFRVNSELAVLLIVLCYTGMRIRVCAVSTSIYQRASPTFQRARTKNPAPSF
jgi:hypothetical protein